MGFEAIAIFGNPDNYVSRGFKSCKKYNVGFPGDIYPAALLVKELKDGALNGHKWHYEESSSYDIDMRRANSPSKNRSQIRSFDLVSGFCFLVFFKSCRKKAVAVFTFNILIPLRIGIKTTFWNKVTEGIKASLFSSRRCLCF